MSGRRRAVGAAGEQAAARWYAAHGYEIVARNWRCREGEIDLVLRRGDTVVICEVKARTSAAYGLPAEAVTWTKQRRLRLLARRWLAESGTRVARVRFDVVSILAGELEVIEGAF